MNKIATIVFAVLAGGFVAQASAAVATKPVDPPVAQAVDSTTCAMVAATSPFQFTPSKNVGVAYNCDTTAVAVNTGNIKGKFTYGGSSNGGSVKQCSTGTTADVDTTNGYTVAAPDPTKNGCS